MAPRRRRRTAAAALAALLRRCGADSGEQAEALALQLELREPESAQQFSELRPLDLQGIQPLGRPRAHVEYIARAAVARGEGHPQDVLLDGRTADFWLPASSAGQDSAPFSLSEPGPDGGTTRLTGVAAVDDLRLMTKPEEVQLPREAFIASAIAGSSNASASGSTWSGVLGLGRWGAARAGRPLMQSVSKADGRSAMAVVLPAARPASASRPARLVLGAQPDSLCRTTVLWADVANSAGAATGDWVVSLEVAAGDFQWRGPATLDFTSAFLLLPEDELPKALAALLGGEGAGQCFQSRPGGGPAGGGGEVLCPCKVIGQRPPLRLAVGPLDLPVPWSELLRPVESEPGLCVLRVNAAEGSEQPSVGLALLGDRALALDFAAERVGACAMDTVPETAPDRPEPLRQEATASEDRQSTNGELAGASTSSRPAAQRPSPSTSTNAGSGVAAEAQSWMGRLGRTPIALMVIIISAVPALLLSFYKKTQRFPSDEFGRRLVWKVDAGSDSGEDSDGIN